MTKDKALKMAIEALEFIKDGGFYTGEDDCIQACKAALKHESINLSCKSVQKRLATQWGYVKAEQPTFIDECITEIDAEIERNGGAWV